MRTEWLEPAFARGRRHVAPFTGLRHFVEGADAAGWLKHPRPWWPPTGAIAGIVEAHEEALALELDERGDRLEPIRWDQHPLEVTVPHWRALVTEVLDAARRTTYDAAVTLESVLVLMESGEGRVLADATAADRGLTWGETAAYGEWSETVRLAHAHGGHRHRRHRLLAVPAAVVLARGHRPRGGRRLDVAAGLDRRRGARHGARRRRPRQGLRRAPRGPRRARDRRARAAVARPRHERPAGAAGRLVHGLAGAGRPRGGGHRPRAARLPRRQGVAGQRPGATGRAPATPRSSCAGGCSPSGRATPPTRCSPSPPRTCAGPGSAPRSAACGGGSPSPARTAAWCCAGGATGSRRRPRSRSGSATASRRSGCTRPPAVRNLRNAVGLGGMTLGTPRAAVGRAAHDRAPRWDAGGTAGRARAQRLRRPPGRADARLDAAAQAPHHPRPSVLALPRRAAPRSRRRPRRRRARSAPCPRRAAGSGPRRRAAPVGGAAARRARR